MHWVVGVSRSLEVTSLGSRAESDTLHMAQRASSAMWENIVCSFITIVVDIYLLEYIKDE